MANSRILPSASAPLSDPRGLATPQFYRFFQALSELDVNSASQADIATLQSEIAAIQDEINALPPAQGYPDLQVSVPLFSQGLLKNGFALIGVNTINSIVVNGNALQLGGDALAPGNTFLYSTGPTGTKGWNALSGMLHQTANILLTTGADGTVTFTLGGAAAGDLSGNYPNPTVAKVNGTALGVTAATAGEVLLGNGTAIASTPISGDATLSGAGALTLAASGVTAGSYGDATHTAAFTVDAKGRLTLAGTAAIAFPVTSVFGRMGAVVAAANDYTFAQIGSKPTTLAGYGITDGLKNSNNLSDVTNASTAFSNIGGVLQTSRVSVFTANGSYTVPANVTRIWISACAGGGGGSGGGSTLSTDNHPGGGSGGGGAGQNILLAPFTVTPGQVIPITIGSAGVGATAGATGGASGNSGTDGTPTIIGSLITLSGGGAGVHGAGSTLFGSGSPGGAGFPNGGSGMDGSVGAFGGFGASCPFGGGGSGGRGGQGGGNTGLNSSGFGSGGGGGGADYLSGQNSTSTAGGNGSPGVVFIFC